MGVLGYDSGRSPAADLALGETGTKGAVRNSEIVRRFGLAATRPASAGALDAG